MGRLAVLKYAAAMLLTVQIVLTIFTFVALYGGDVSPIGHSARAMLVYVLPILILANAGMLIYWIIRRKWLILLIPVITIACCIPYIGTIWQFRSLDKSADAQPGIKVATYNVCMFNRETSGFMAQDILAEMRRQNVDILCMQEYNEVSGEKKNSDSYKEYFPYMAVGREDMVIYSRYPIKGSKKLLLMIPTTVPCGLILMLKVTKSAFLTFTSRPQVSTAQYTRQESYRHKVLKWTTTDSWKPSLATTCWV